MLLLVVAFLGGVLTILSPCILPVLPFVFTRTGQPFVRTGLPLLVGMAVTFAVVATLAAVGGGWVVQANQWGRWIALALVLVFGLALLLPGLADRMSRPVVALGNRLSSSARARRQPGLVVLARCCDRHALGALRGADSRLDLDRRGAARRKRRDVAAAPRIRAGHRRVARCRAAARRQSVCRDETLARRRGVDSARAGRRSGRGCACDRVRPRYRLPRARLHGEHDEARGVGVRAADARTRSI